VQTNAIHCYSVDQAAAHFCPLSRNAERHERLKRVVRRLWNADTSEVRVCENCGFGFGWPHVGGDDEYYGILHEQAGYPADRWEYGLTISRGLQRYPHGGRILDIGTGDGSFLKKLPSMWRTFATEGSETTRGRLRAGGIECFGSTADALAHAAGSFQVVTMFQVLEHVARFHGLLADCFGLLQPGGMIAISVPLGSAMFAQERLTGCQDMTPNHINKWSPESLALALQTAGFAPEPALIEPGSVGAAFYRAGLMTRAQAADNPRSLAAAAYRVQQRVPRMALLALISGVNFMGSLPKLPQLMTGSSFLMLGSKPVNGG
jgi:2-polyprenyl-3-methyl-5-hydroxy-6-metoxy-1,4-benzoquinol methylase